MTCIVGLIDKERVIIGGDSAGWTSDLVVSRKDTKVFKNGDFIFGCSSSFRMIQILRFSFKPPEIKSKEIYEYMCTDFVNSIRSCFKDGGYLQKFTDGDEKGGVFLVAYKNRLFKIECDFQVAENIDNFDAIGSGANFAFGSIYTLSNKSCKLTPEKKVLKSLETAAFFCDGVRPPFIIMST